jgi:hypothetical protein
VSVESSEATATVFTIRLSRGTATSER